MSALLVSEVSTRRFYGRGCGQSTNGGWHERVEPGKLALGGGARGGSEITPCLSATRKLSRNGLGEEINGDLPEEDFWPE